MYVESNAYTWIGWCVLYFFVVANVGIMFLLTEKRMAGGRYVS